MTPEKAQPKPNVGAMVAPASAPSVIARLAERFGVDQTKMLDCLKGTAFKGGCSNEQLMALCIVADQYKLNPWTREIYAFPDKNNGIVPVVGVDGWARIVNEHPQFNGVEFTFKENAGKLVSCTCTIYRKDREHPVICEEFLSECGRKTQPWESHPRRMMRHKAFIQASRLAFGFAGIYDLDEAERIVGAEEKRVDARPGRSPLESAQHLPPPTVPSGEQVIDPPPFPPAGQPVDIEPITTDGGEPAAEDDDTPY